MKRFDRLVVSDPFLALAAKRQAGRWKTASSVSVPVSLSYVKIFVKNRFPARRTFSFHPFSPFLSSVYQNISIALANTTSNFNIIRL